MKGERESNKRRTAVATVVLLLLYKEKYTVFMRFVAFDKHIKIIVIESSKWKKEKLEKIGRTKRNKKTWSKILIYGGQTYGF